MQWPSFHLCSRIPISMRQPILRSVCSQQPRLQQQRVSSLLTVLASYVITFVARLGFSYSSATPSQCIESPYVSTSNYVNRTPICQFSINAAGDVLLTVSNLRTTGTSQPNTYGLLVSGLIMGPSAQSNYLNGVASTGCYVQTYAGSVKVDKIYSNNFFLNYVYKTSDVTLSGNPAQNGQVGTLTVVFKLGQPIPAQGSFTVVLPLQNANYDGYGISPTRSMVLNTQMTATVTYRSTSSTMSQSLGTITPTFDFTQISTTSVFVLLGNTASLSVGTILSVVYTNVIMPPNLAPLSGFSIYSGDQFYNLIEFADYPTLTNSLPGTDATAYLPSEVKITANDEVSATDATYYFTVYTTNDVPMNGVITIQVPASVTIPASGLTLLCENGCASTTTLSVANNLITLSGAVPTLSSYVINPGPFQFAITGFTNPSDANPAYFVWTSYAVLSSGTFMIDQISKMSVSATKAVCSVYAFHPSDGNTHIYGVASNWTATLSCSNSITPAMGLRITLPADFYVIQNSYCLVGLHSSSYTCRADSATSSITIMSFAKKTIPKQTKFSISFNSLRNPTVTGQKYTVSFESLSQTGGVIGTGTFETSVSLITVGFIKQFSVKPQSLGVGQFPVFYDFVVQPSGEVYKGASLVITLPENIQIYNSHLLSQNCAYNITGFTQTYFQCSLVGNQIVIQNGFQNYATSTMLFLDQMITPTLKFTLPQFWNPRTTQITTEFGLSIFSDQMQEIYAWSGNTSVTVNGKASTSVSAGPAVQMTTPATPQSVSFKANSNINSAVTDYNLTVTTTNYLEQNDVIAIKLPSPLKFTSTSRVLGVSSNLALNLTTQVSADYQTITTEIALSRRRLLASQISAGSTIVLILTAVQNAPSTAPSTSSVIYSAYSSGQLFEQQSSGLTVKNSRPGQFAAVQIQPSNFKPSTKANYTLQINLGGFVQNMLIKIGVPNQLNLTSFSSCWGLFGTDSTNLSCSLTNRTITVVDAVTFQTISPKILKIQLNSFVNPSNRIVTDSFNITTITSDGYIIDNLQSNVTVNFWCEYPCKTCNSINSQQCHSCYNDAYSFWSNYQCVDVCNLGYFAQGGNCTICESPSKTCTIDGPLSCISGYFLLGKQCTPIVYWPFPFVFVCLASLFLILICDRITKNDTRLKESYVAIVSLAEVGSWTCFLVFHYIRSGYLGAFFLGGIAAAIFLLLTWFHAITHACKIQNEAEVQYRQNTKNYPCSTAMCRVLSSLVSFKFSLIEISHLTKKQQVDYNSRNWRVFNIFALIFMLIPYPVMMLACGYFVYTENIFSYTGFCAIETIAVSTLIVCLLFLDAITVIKCVDCCKRKKPRVGDYESDREPKQKQREMTEFGDLRTDLDGSQKSLMRPGPEIMIELSDCSQPSSYDSKSLDQQESVIYTQEVLKQQNYKQAANFKQDIMVASVPKSFPDYQPLKKQIIAHSESSEVFLSRPEADCDYIYCESSQDLDFVDKSSPIFDTIKLSASFTNYQLLRQPVKSEKSVAPFSSSEVYLQNEEIEYSYLEQDSSYPAQLLLNQISGLEAQFGEEQEEAVLTIKCLQPEIALQEACSSVQMSESLIEAGATTPLNREIDQAKSASTQMWVAQSPSRGQTAQPQASLALDHIEQGISQVGSEKEMVKCLTAEIFFRNDLSCSKDVSQVTAEQNILSQPSIVPKEDQLQIEAIDNIDCVPPITAAKSYEQREALDCVDQVYAEPALQSNIDQSDSTQEKWFLNNQLARSQVNFVCEQNVRGQITTKAVMESLKYSKEHQSQFQNSILQATIRAENTPTSKINKNPLKETEKQAIQDSSFSLSEDGGEVEGFADLEGCSQSEEDVVHHNTAFNYEPPKKQLDRKVQFYDDQNEKSESSEGVLHTQFSGIEQQLIVKQSGKQLALLYSDKSESSVDELMHDTPSNYNEINNRLGKSASLKQKTPLVAQSLQLPQRRNNEAEERRFVTSLHGPISTIIEENSRNTRQFTELDKVQPKKALRKNNYF